MWQTIVSYIEALSTLDIIILVGLCVGGLYFLKSYFGAGQDRPTSNVASFKVITPTSNNVTATTTPTAGSSNFIDKMKATGRTIVVFYGSQTGTAEDFATRLAKNAASYGLKAMAVDPEECEMDLLPRLSEIPNSLAIFCMATYGEGDPTDNAQEFVDWLKQGEESLKGLRYTVFGLGNRTYEHFNSTGIYVDKRLAELGGERVFRLGLGDDDANIEEDFVSWQEEMWHTVCDYFGISAEAREVLVRQYQLQVLENIPEDKLYKGEVARLGSYRNQKPPYDAKNPFMAEITSIRELHSGGGRSCLHVELDLTGSRLKYDCGDHLAVLPCNDQELVERLGNRLKADLDVVFTLNNVDEDSNKRHPFPCPCTFRTALSYYVDICTPPKTNVLRELAEYTTDEEEKARLKLMSQATEEGKSKYKEYIVEQCRSLLHVLDDMPNLSPPLALLCELLPRLQARYYSISSSPKEHPTSVHITAVVVSYTTPLGYQVGGVATSWMAKQCPIVWNADKENGVKPRLPVFVRRSQFRMPYKCSTPIIMVGPGTGLAPFRGFIHDRLHDKRAGKPVGDAVLYFGCRKKAEDYIYHDELATALLEGGLTALHVAFSRDQNQKEYVQHLMRREENAAQIWKLLEEGAHFYVCGDARNMAREVLSTLEFILQQQGGMDQTKAKDYIKRLQTKGRYSADVWS